MTFLRWVGALADLSAGAGPTFTTLAARTIVKAA